MAQARSDSDWMRAALSLARRGLGNVWPNPSVGCVIVKDGRVIGRGHTAPGGRPHAETQAISQAGDAAAGATAFVTLEPCAHTGQTPPCASALIAAGIARVVIAQTDPDPRVDGGGIAMLKSAGIAVKTGICANEAADINAGFITRVTQNRPLLTLKLATTLDGRIAMASGESRWITGPLARRRVHQMRRSHDAVLIGSGTAKADDPMLDVRGMGPGPQPVRIVADARLSLPMTHRLVTSAATQPTWILHSDHAPAERITAMGDAGVRCINVGRRDGRQMDLEQALTDLAGVGLTRVFCEGGGTFAASLLQADLVDRLVLFTAGKAIGATGIPALGALDIGTLSQTDRFALTDTEICGADAVSYWSRH